MQRRELAVNWGRNQCFLSGPAGPCYTSRAVRISSGERLMFIMGTVGTDMNSPFCFLLQWRFGARAQHCGELDGDCMWSILAVT